MPAQRRVEEASKFVRGHAATETGAMWDARLKRRYVWMLAMNRVVKVTIIQRLHDKNFYTESVVFSLIYPVSSFIRTAIASLPESFKI